jgi:hypothetical protein
VPSMEMVAGRVGRERRQRGSVSEVLLLLAVAFECVVAGTWEAGRCCRVAVVVVCAEGEPARKVKPESDFPVSGSEGSLVNQSSWCPIDLGLVFVGSGVLTVDVTSSLEDLGVVFADLGQLGLAPGDTGILSEDLECSCADLGISSRSIG